MSNASLEVAEGERLLADFFKRSEVGLAIFDENLRFQMVDPSLAAMNRTSVESHIGKHAWEILGEVGWQVERAVKQVFSTAKPILNHEFAGVLLRRPEGGHWIDLLFPICDSMSKVKQVGVVVVELKKDIQLQSTQLRPPHAQTVLQSWKDIARYVGTCTRTVQRWEREYRFPIRRINPNKGSVVFAFQEEIEEWLEGSKLQAPNARLRKRYKAPKMIALHFR